ncbi:MAG: hypothetical protein ACR2PH_16285 [Desulfobulbia bacterium]
MSNNSYFISWLSLVLALTSLLLTPVIVFINDDRQPTWDQLSEQLGLMFNGAAIAVFFLLVSFGSGIFAWRRRKIVLLWVIPIGITVVVALGLLLALLIAPYWKASFL